MSIPKREPGSLMGGDLNMGPITVVLGALLTLLGLVAYVATGGQSITALIPAFFGAPLVALGLLARNERRRKLVMHVASALALLGFLGSARGISGVIDWVGGNEVARPAAAVVQSLMAALCGIFVILAIRSFVLARRERSP